MEVWAIGIYDLRLSMTVFWSLTPCQIWALSKRKQWDSYRSDHRIALLTCLTANVHRKKGTRAYKVEDFMPEYNLLKKKIESSDEMLAKFSSMVPLINAQAKSNGG